MAMNQEWKEVGADFVKIGGELAVVFGKLGKLTVKAVGEGAGKVKEWAEAQASKKAAAEEEATEAPCEEAPAEVEIPEEAPAEEAAEETRFVPNANWEAARDAAVEALTNFSKVAMKALQTGMVYVEEAAGKAAEKLRPEEKTAEEAEAAEDTETIQEVAAVVEEALTAEDVGAVVEEALEEKTEE